MGKSEEVKRLWFPAASRRSLPGSVAPELDDTCLGGMQPQTELREPFPSIGEELLRIGLMPEPGDESHRARCTMTNVTVRILTPPMPDPPVENVMEVDIGERIPACPLILYGSIVRTIHRSVSSPTDSAALPHCCR